MNKLTAKHLTALTYFKDGQSVSVCTSVGTALGNLSFSVKPPRGLTRPVLDTLYRWGLLKTSESNAFGIRWAKFSLSVKGSNTINLIGETEHE